MTRINAGVAPRELHRRHLIAEYREIPMVPAALRRSLRTSEPDQVMSRIPAAFYGLWQETPEARNLILERIAQRQAEKPHLYGGEK
jgi:hypothetical protein